MPKKKNALSFLVLVAVLIILLGCTPPEPSCSKAEGEFTLLVMTYPEEGNFDKFEFVLKKYKRQYENPICGSTPSRPN